jgi:hypothetical protein
VIAVALGLAAGAGPAPALHAQERAPAPETREALIAAEQAEKAKRLRPEARSRAEQYVVRYVSGSTFFGGQIRGFYPWVGSVFGGAGAGFGAGYLQHLPDGASLNATGGFSDNGSTFAQLVAVAPETANGRLTANASARITDVNEVNFFGLGQDTTVDDRQQYNYRPIELGAAATIRAAPRVSVTGGVSRLWLSTWGDLAFTQQVPSPAPGFGTDLDFNVFEAVADFDTRPSASYSTHGTHLVARYTQYHEAADRPYSFDRWDYEASHLLPLVREQFVLAFRGRLITTGTGGVNEVPFMLSPYLGSGSTLRGFRNRRFTDRQAMVVTAEYRWRPSRYLDLAVFMDSGQVASAVRKLALERFVTAWGIGSRFHGPAFTAFRIEVARSPEGLRMVWAAEQPF